MVETPVISEPPTRCQKIGAARNWSTKWPNWYSHPVSRHTVALHSVALRFPGFGEVSQENRATPPQKGPVAPTFSALEGGCRISSCRSETVALQGGVAATLSPGALQWAT